MRLALNEDLDQEEAMLEEEELEDSVSYKVQMLCWTYFISKLSKGNCTVTFL